MKEKLYFITGNKKKFENAKEIIPEIEQIDIDVCEIQELDTKKILEEKLIEASKVSKGRFICEDVSFEIKSLNGLPGPLIKWFLKALGVEGIYKLIENCEDKLVIVRLTLAYSNGDNVIYFEETQGGSMVFPRGDGGFGWDSLFQPFGSEKTYAEMNRGEKDMFGVRNKVLLKLKEYIDSNKNGNN